MSSWRIRHHLKLINLHNARLGIYPGSLTDQDCPDVDEDEQQNIRKFLQGKEKREDVVGYALREAVERMEGMTGKGGRHDPFVMLLVQFLIDQRMMQSPVDPIDAQIGKKDEEGKL